MRSAAAALRSVMPPPAAAPLPSSTPPRGAPVLSIGENGRVVPRDANLTLHLVTAQSSSVVCSDLLGVWQRIQVFRPASIVVARFPLDDDVVSCGAREDFSFSLPSLPQSGGNY